MARSKNRVLKVEQVDHGKFIEAQVELENGEVVIAGYERGMWIQCPEALTPFYNALMSQPLVGVYGNRSSQKSKQGRK